MTEKAKCPECGHEFEHTSRNCCWYCGGTVIWGADFDFDDYGYDGEGVVSELHCKDCGARITYTIGDSDGD